MSTTKGKVEWLAQVAATDLFDGKRKEAACEQTASLNVTLLFWFRCVLGARWCRAVLTLVVTAKYGGVAVAVGGQL